jgi:uncharacterized protein (DUF427 family)
MKDILSVAREQLRYEPIEPRVRALIGSGAVVDSTRAVLVWEPGRVVPSYAVPADDISVRMEPAPADGDRPADVLHPGIAFGVHTAAGEPLTIGGRAGAGFRLADADLDGYVVLDFKAFDGWYEEDEPVAGHPRDPYHRVEVRRSARPVRIEVDGEVIAETVGARFVLETNLPARFYLSRDDVRAELRPSARRTYCPYKGEAAYWSVEAGGRLHEDLGWSYERPLPEMAPLTGLVAFWDERVDVFLDGEPRARPGGRIAAALRDEFRV